jgi:hypothetical protein
VPRIPTLRMSASTRCGAMLLALAASSAITEPALADEPVREVRHDPSAYPAPATRWSLLAVGALTTAAWYGLAYGGSYLYPTARGAEELKIPIAGPWMSLAETGCPETTPDCSTFWMVVGVILKTFDGIGQAGGLLIMAEGLFLPTVEPKPSAAQSTRVLASPEPRVTIVPTAVPGGLGVGVAGLF